MRTISWIVAGMAAITVSLLALSACDDGALTGLDDVDPSAGANARVAPGDSTARAGGVPGEAASSLDRYALLGRILSADGNPDSVRVHVKSWHTDYNETGYATLGIPAKGTIYHWGAAHSEGVDIHGEGGVPALGRDALYALSFDSPARGDALLVLLPSAVDVDTYFTWDNGDIAITSQAIGARTHILEDISSYNDIGWRKAVCAGGRFGRIVFEGDSLDVSTVLHRRFYGAISGEAEGEIPKDVSGCGTSSDAFDVQLLGFADDDAYQMIDWRPIVSESISESESVLVSKSKSESVSESVFVSESVSAKSSTASTTASGSGNGLNRSKPAVDVGADQTVAEGAMMMATSDAQSDRAALVALYDSTDGANWDDNTNWNGSAAIGTWYGVTTDAAGRVVSLDLGFNSLSGSIPAELGDLTNLENLYLSGNDLSGSIPAELGDLTNLEILDIYGNDLSGSIPAALGDLANLEILYLHDNYLSGSIPAALGDLANLENLNLRGNTLSGSIPAELGDLANLEVLYLWSNSLSGSIPAALGDLTNLEILDLYDNDLTGSIPAQLGDLTNLDTLRLWGNSLSGSIPAELGDLANLEILYLQNNSLSGSIPAELGDLTNLENLNLRSNSLSGSIPAELGDLTGLEVLALYDNDLTGSIPAELGNLTNLKQLWLHDNSLTGSIPTELGDLTNLEWLWLQNNSLTGLIPAAFVNLSNLSNFSVDNGLCVPGDTAFQQWLGDLTVFSGDSDNICNDPPVANAGLDQTVAEGATVTLSGSGTDSNGNALINPTYAWGASAGITLMPDSTVAAPTFTAPTQLVSDSVLTFTLTVNDGTQDSAKDTVLVTVYQKDRAALVALYDSTDGANWKHNDNWNGNAAIDTWYGVRTDDAGRVVSLNLFRNDLSGSIPAALGDLANLEHLNLASNDLSGSIPAALGDLTNLESLNLFRNDLSGSIPAELGDLANLTSLSIGENSFSGSIPAALGDLANLEWLNLASNSLSGSIPAALGDLANLTGLSIGENSLSGSIPAELGDLANLMRLWIGENDLSGSIPSEFVNLDNLISLKVDDELCVPGDTAFQQWLGDLDEFEGDSDNICNDAPTADAGPDQTVDEGDTVTLDGSGSSDPEGAALTYTWVSLDNIALSSTAEPHERTFTAPTQLLSNAVLEFTLTVNDGTQDSAADTVVVTVTGTNDAPTANAGADQTVDEGDTVTLSGSGTDPEDASLTYTWVSLDNIALSSTTEPHERRFTAPTQLLSDSVLEFELTVNDGTQDSAPDTVVVTVNAGPNDAPMADAGSDQTVDEGDTVTLSGSGTDPEGASLTYTWVSLDNIALSSTTEPHERRFTAPTQLLSDSVLEFELTVNDGTQDSAPDTVVVTVNAGPNDAPTANAGPDQTVDEGDTVTLSGSGTDPEGATLTYTWVSLDNIALSSTTEPHERRFTAPTQLVSDSVLEFELTVNDGTQDSAPDTVVVTVNAGPNDAPTADAGADQTVAEGDTVTLSGSGTDPEGATLTYTWVSLDNIALSSTTEPHERRFTAPTQLVSDSVLEFELTVNDGTQDSAPDTVVVTVNAGPNDAPTADAGADQTVAEGDTVTLSGSGTDPEGATLTYTWVSLDNIALSSTTEPHERRFTAPTQLVSDSVLEFELTVNDGTQDSAPDTVVVTVNAGPNDAPTADAGPDQTVDEGDTVTLSGSGTDPEDASLTYTWVSLDNIALSSTTEPHERRFTAPTQLLSDSVLEFELTVNDGTQDSAPDTVVVTVTSGVQNDRAALVALYNATGGANWSNNNNWNSSAAIGTWSFVTTDGAGRVTLLNLRSNSLSGSIPAALGDLTNLEFLGLNDNSLSGSIPAALGDLTNLEKLYLNENSLSGSIPAALGDLTNLERLALDNNDLTGSIPAALGDLTKLETLVLNSNSLTGSIPAALGDLTNLEHLDLERNSLTGSIPAALGDLTNIERLYLGSNSLTGSIPAWLGDLTNLERLYLDGNSLSGSIPAALGDLTNLESLSLYRNSLSGSIPAALGDLTNLEYLGLNDNSLSGSIPAALGDLTNLERLHLWDNSLSGSIPAALGDLTNLKLLYLYNNSLTGSIPAELGDLTNLEVLGLRNNSLTGSIPAAFVNLDDLRILRVDDELCVPGDTAFQQWLGDLDEFEGDSDNICN